jgi:small subunit ribosomal protein S4
VGDRVVDRPSFEVSAGDRVRIKPGSAVSPLSREALELAIAPPPWLTVDEDSLGGTMLRQPVPNEVLVPFDETRIIEFYSR